MTTSTRARSKRVATLAHHAQAEACVMEVSAGGDRVLRALRAAHQALRDLNVAQREIAAATQAQRVGSLRAARLLSQYDFAGTTLVAVGRWDGSERRRQDRRQRAEAAA